MLNTKERREIAKIATQLMSKGVKLQSKKLVIRAFDMIDEDDEFNWDYLDSEFSQWDEISEKGIDIIYSNIH
jgi:hypothetical protein